MHTILLLNARWTFEENAHRRPPTFSANSAHETSDCPYYSVQAVLSLLSWIVSVLIMIQPAAVAGLDALEYIPVIGTPLALVAHVRSFAAESPWMLL